MLGQLRKTAGSPESGLPASNINAADCYSNLSATAEIINTSSARGTAALTLKVKPSLFSCVNISTEISECFGTRIASTPSFDFGSTVSSSWAVAVLRGQNEHPYRLSSIFWNPRREFFTDNDRTCQTESQRSLGFEREVRITHSSVQGILPESGNRLFSESNNPSSTKKASFR